MALQNSRLPRIPTHHVINLSAGIMHGPDNCTSDACQPSADIMQTRGLEAIEYITSTLSHLLPVLLSNGLPTFLG